MTCLAGSRWLAPEIHPSARPSLAFGHYNTSPIGLRFALSPITELFWSAAVHMDGAIAYEW